MTIKVSKDAERALGAVVRDRRFASADEMMGWLVREYAGRHLASATSEQSLADGVEDTPDVFWGRMRDEST